MRIETIYRYPVKGLTPERMARATLRRGRAIAWDRAFALAQGDCGFDAAAPAWRPKTEFLCLARNAEAAGLLARFDAAGRCLSLVAPDGAALDADPFSAEGRGAIGGFIAAALPAAMRGATRFVHAADHSFCDHRTQVISLIGLSSIAALEAAAGGVRHKLRFRANLYLADLAAWDEFTWLGRCLAIGDARLRVTERIDRCAATSINPETGARDANPVKELRQSFGHVDCGVFAEVIEDGTITPGDAVRLLA
ncbi:MOSC domain-containing protein [Acidiphilium sp.]|uniref:MOSC domain-containing protein n=1 Tax=Acidiphilium sp. TaxID=527 RepID=UPI003D04D8FA